MRIYLRVACATLPILIGVALGQTTVAAMQFTPASSDAYLPPPEPQDRYAMGRRWAAKHHPEDANACPTIDELFESGCIAATRY